MRKRNWWCPECATPFKAPSPFKAPPPFKAPLSAGGDSKSGSDQPSAGKMAALAGLVAVSEGRPRYSSRQPRPPQRLSYPR